MRIARTKHTLYEQDEQHSQWLFLIKLTNLLAADQKLKDMQLVHVLISPLVAAIVAAIIYFQSATDVVVWYYRTVGEVDLNN